MSWDVHFKGTVKVTEFTLRQAHHQNLIRRPSDGLPLTDPRRALLLTPEQTEQ